MDFVAKAKPDGYTMAATVRSTVSITPVIQATVPYRLKDFAMIGSYAASAQAIVVKQDAPWKSLEELIADAKANPGKHTYGSAGQGTNSYFTMELLKLARPGHRPCPLRRLGPHEDRHPRRSRADRRDFAEHDDSRD